MKFFVSLSVDGGKYVHLRFLNLSCDHPDHYEEWIEGVSPTWKDDVKIYAISSFTMLTLPLSLITHGACLV